MHFFCKKEKEVCPDLVARPICFDPVIGGSNVFGFMPNLVSTFYT